MPAQSRFVTIHCSENYRANSFENKKSNKIWDWLLRGDQRQVPQPTNIASLIHIFSILDYSPAHVTWICDFRKSPGTISPRETIGLPRGSGRKACCSLVNMGIMGSDLWASYVRQPARARANLKCHQAKRLRLYAYPFQCWTLCSHVEVSLQQRSAWTVPGARIVSWRQPGDGL